VEEGERPPVDREALVQEFEPAAVKVPVGDVVRLVTQQRRRGKEAWYEVDPPLVDHQALNWTDPTVVSQALLPPREQTLRVRPLPQGDEAEVVCARDEDVLLARTLAVQRDRLEQVRDQDNLGAEQ
jgi:hypothetical protein